MLPSGWNKEGGYTASSEPSKLCHWSFGSLSGWSLWHRFLSFFMRKGQWRWWIKSELWMDFREQLGEKITGTFTHREHHMMWALASTLEVSLCQASGVWHLSSYDFQFICNNVLGWRQLEWQFQMSEISKFPHQKETTLSRSVLRDKMSFCSYTYIYDLHWVSNLCTILLKRIEKSCARYS